MLTPISSATQPHATEQTTSTSPATSSASQTKTQPVTSPVDTVQISAAAKAMQGVIETPAQTAKEAAAGDVQAKHLLAREAADKTNGL